MENVSIPWEVLNVIASLDISLMSPHINALITTNVILRVRNIFRRNVEDTP